MSAVAAEVAAGRGRTDVLRAARVPAVIVAVVVLTGVVLALTDTGGGRGPLDPSGTAPQGGRALAALLRDRGVQVHRTTSTTDTVARASGAATVFVPFPDFLSSDSLHRLASLRGGSRLVLVAPSSDALGQLGSDVRETGAAPVRRRLAGCSLAEAVAAGDADLGGGRYAQGAFGQRCYDASLVTGRTGGGGSLTVVGAPDPFTNDRLGERGNAALTLGLLGGGADVFWLLPGRSEVAQGDKPLLRVLPGWVGPVLVDLLLAGLVLVLWRGRRLGPVVAEPLPVIVRAAETVEGRSRLYRRGRARDTAAAALRSGARARLAGPLGLGGEPAPEALAAAVASRAGRPVAVAGGLLYGPAPADDPALVRLATDLDELVRTTLTREGRRA